MQFGRVHLPDLYQERYNALAREWATGQEPETLVS